MSLQRPGFRRDEFMIDDNSKRLDIKNKRRGVGNRTIQRPGAKRAPGIPRSISFNRMSVIGSQNAGIVELGEKTLAKLFEVKVPDKTDITWIAEKQRLLKKYQTEGMTLEEAKAEVKMNKPLGREQRTITKQANIAQSGLSTADKLDEISEEVS